MAPRPRWWHQLQASKNEAVLAVDLYNRSAHERQLEAFVVHMCLAWLKLLQAKYTRRGGDLYVRDANGRRRRTQDGDWVMKPLRELVQEVFPAGDPVRANVEFFIGLRNKIEHRHDHDVAALVAGKSQALLVNYERTVVDEFGADEGLADRLRLPLFISTITDDAVEILKAVRRRVPKAVLEYVEDFDAALEPELSSDQRYEFRIYLVPQTGPKTSADVAMSFVRLEDLDADQAALMERMQTVIREKQVPVADLDTLLPSKVVERVGRQIPWRFTLNDHASAWRYWQVRPPKDVEHPERTKSEFCRYNGAFKQYVYTDAWVNFLVRKLSDPVIFGEVTGRTAVEAEGAAAQVADDEVKPSDVAGG
ncbi:DUF3644 domain-containing protein [Amycolatopsis thermoflava]|uniref:DUF3644 domain-containing protein n=1 Tax=Amycolatopsis thermoflava TaxID=84480 RepID=UPI003D720E21